LSVDASSTLRSSTPKGHAKGPKDCCTEGCQALTSKTQWDASGCQDQES
jgi:hypothetical protein